jgi:hypothetical protein
VYTASDLSKMFNVTPKTIYKKLKDIKVKEFVVNTKDGLRLQQEGFNHFQMLMADSKVNNRVTVEQLQVNDSVKDDYISNLKVQIEDLKKDKVMLIEQLEKQTKLTEYSQLLLLESAKEKKSFWQRLFNS